MLGLTPGKGNSYRKPFGYGGFFYALTLYSEISTPFREYSVAKTCGLGTSNPLFQSRDFNKATPRISNHDVPKGQAVRPSSRTVE